MTLEDINAAEASISLFIVESITYNKEDLDLEENVFREIFRGARHFFQKKDKAFYRFGMFCFECAEQFRESMSRVENIIYDKNVFVLDVKSIESDDLQLSPLSALGAVTGALHHFDIQGEIELADEIGDKAKRALQNHDDDKLFSFVIALDGLCHFA